MVLCTGINKLSLLAETLITAQHFLTNSSKHSTVIYSRAVRSVIPFHNHWPSLISCCSYNHLEHMACLCPVITIYPNFLLSAEDVLVSTGISRHHHLTLLTMLSWILKWLLLY